MGTIVKREDSRGTVRYTARIRKRGLPHFVSTFSRKTDAQDWIRQEEDKIRRGLSPLEEIEAKRHTLNEALDRFTAQEKPERDRTLQLTRWRDKLGSRMLSHVTHIAIHEVIDEWKRGDGLKQTFKDNTIRNHLSTLSKVFRSCRKWGWVTRNPLQEVERPPLPRGIVRYLDDDERERLLKACKESDYKPLYLIVVLALSTGMRKEELLSLKWSSLDLGIGTIILHKTKNKETRRVPVRGLALTLLKQHAKVRHISSEFVFPGEKPSPNKPCSKVAQNSRHFDIRKPWQRALKDSKIETFRFHDLRHSCASYLAMNGASLLEIAEVLGHKTLEVVKRYAHLAESHTAGVVERMNQKIFGG
jgi:integrase